MSWIGLDIGGANIKMAMRNPLNASSGFAISQPFPMWKRSGDLESELGRLIAHIRDKSEIQNLRLAVTMTGELADSFSSKPEGVDFIVRATENAAEEYHCSEVKFYQVGGVWADGNKAVRSWRKTAASNWHAMAELVSKKYLAPQSQAILVDIGSTTTDIIPIANEQVLAQGKCDLSRLKNSELVYLGVGRTPVGMIANQFELSVGSVPVARELFATVKDVLVVLSKLDQDPDDLETADGRPRTLACCQKRLARMVCCDAKELADSDIVAIAEQTYDIVRSMLKNAIQEVARRSGGLKMILVSGEGDWLIKEIIEENAAKLNVSSVELLSEKLTFETSICGPAYAVSVLAGEEFGDV